jgi:hypothetical protein
MDAHANTMESSPGELAGARLARETAQAPQIQQDILTVRELGRRVPQTPGVHAATQLLNAQMNLMLQQTTRLVALTSEAQGSDRAAAIEKEATNRAAARAIAAHHQQRSRHKQRQHRLIDSMRGPGQ